jgi:hypothetical protein
MMPGIYDFLFIDEDRVRMYTAQLVGKKGRITKLVDKIKVGFQGVTGEVTFRDKPHRENIFLALTDLETFLDKKGVIGLERPYQVNWGDLLAFPFYRETMIATKVTLPRNLTRRVPGLNALVIWISDPQEGHLGSEKDFQFTGTFLYLLEAHTEDGVFRSTLTGCSALQAVVNITFGKDLLERNSGEPFGRGNYQHPVEKLQSIGGIASFPRKITALYKKRYMTDEQRFTFNGQRFRSCDLLAYPIYIRSS